MASVGDLATDRTIKNLKTELALVDGTSYVVVNDGYFPVYVEEEAAQPGANTRGWYRLSGTKDGANNTMQVEPSAGNGIFITSDRPGHVTVHDAI